MAVAGSVSGAKMKIMLMVFIYFENESIGLISKFRYTAAGTQSVFTRSNIVFNCIKKRAHNKIRFLRDDIAAKKRSLKFLFNSLQLYALRLNSIKCV